MKRTTLCYIRQDDRYLMLHRVGSKKQEGSDENAGKWIGFGGKFEEGETPEQCVLREVFEETGLTLTRYAYRGVIDFHSDLWPDEEMHLFTADAFEGQVREGGGDEGEIAWIEVARYRSLPMWEGDAIFLSLIDSPDTPFFGLSLRYEGEELKEAVLNGVPLARGDDGEWR